MNALMWLNITLVWLLCLNGRIERQKLVSSELLVHYNLDYHRVIYKDDVWRLISLKEFIRNQSRLYVYSGLFCESEGLPPSTSKLPIPATMPVSWWDATLHNICMILGGILRDLMRVFSIAFWGYFVSHGEFSRNICQSNTDTGHAASMSMLPYH
jgi:hypothetical protein